MKKFLLIFLLFPSLCFGYEEGDIVQDLNGDWYTISGNIVTIPQTMTYSQTEYTGLTMPPCQDWAQMPERHTREGAVDTGTGCSWTLKFWSTFTPYTPPVTENLTMTEGEAIIYSLGLLWGMGGAILIGVTWKG